MSGLRKFLLLLVACFVFSTTAYNLIWGTDWQAKYSAEVRTRRVMVIEYAQALVHPVDNIHQLRIEAFNQAQPGLEESIFQRLLVCLGLTLVITCGAGLGAAFLSFKKADGRIRGAEIIFAGELKRLIFWRQNKGKIFLAVAYAGLSAALLPALLSRWFFPVWLVLAGLPVGLICFFLIEHLTKEKKRIAITIGGVPIPPQLEARHFLIEGTTGAGKSQAIFQMVKDARSRGDRGLIMDIGSAYRERFMRLGDVVLSPDGASPSTWNPFLEIRTLQDIPALSNSVIPDGTGESKGWNDKARVLFSAILGALWGAGEHSISRLIYLCCTAEPDELKPYLAGTTAASLIQAGNETPFQNCRGILTTYIQPWAFLQDGGDFSFCEWIQKRQPGQWVFITYTSRQLKAVRPLLATWLDLAIMETLCLMPQTARPTWFIADEYDSLGQVSSMRDALTKLRKHEGRCVLGLQTYSQVVSTYGRDNANVLLSCLSNKLILRAGDHDTAEYCSKTLGDQELMRQDESKTRRGLMGLGGDPSKSLAERHVTERIVMPSEITTSKDLHGWLALAGDHPVARVKIPIPKL